MQSRYRTVQNANIELLSLYYCVGQYISANTRSGKWGTGAIESISAQLQGELPGLHGFSPTNMKRYSAFFNSAVTDCRIERNQNDGVFQGRLHSSFYLSALDKYMKKPNENKTIGILLCQEMNRTVVELAVQDYDKPMGIATYRLGNEIPEPYTALIPVIDGVQQILFENGENENNMNDNYGVFAKADCEIAVSEKFILIFQKLPDCLSTRLYENGKLIAICEHNLSDKVTSYAFINSKNESVSFNGNKLKSQLGQDVVWKQEDFFLKDKIEIIPVETPMPAVSEKGIAYCLKNWKLGNQLNVSEDSINFTMNTNKIEYVMMIRKINNDIYCGASIVIPYDTGLLGGHQYFRIRNYSDNSQPWCGFHCDLGKKADIPKFDIPECPTGKCLTTKQGLFFELKRHTDDEIVLQGCGDDEYFYYRDVYMTEKFKF